MSDIFCDCMWYFLNGSDYVFFFFIVCSYIIAVGDQVIKRGGAGSGLTPPHFCDCPEPEFPTSYAWYFCVQWVNVRGDCLCSVGQCKR